MNADQVIEGIGNVVAAAKPAQEYCFLWIDWWPMCLTKSEWSGWVQSIGVLVAMCAPWIHSYFVRRRAKALALDVFNQALHIAKRGNRLDAILGSVPSDPQQLQEAYGTASAIAHSIRDLTEDELSALHLFAPVAVSRLRTCAELRAKLLGLLGLAAERQLPNDAHQHIYKEAARYAREYRELTADAVSLMRDSGWGSRPRKY